MAELTPAERDAQKAYWKEHSSEATVEAMMLDSQAADIDKMERPEVRPSPWPSACRTQSSAPVRRTACFLPTRRPDDLRAQVMRLLGPVDGLRVVELGAGIGRFTGPLAAAAKSVLALDFMQNLIDENEATNAHLGNVSFRCGDVTELRLGAASADVVFSNWLLMYLSDEEVAALAGHMLEWLDEGGCVFFRESCFRQSGDRARGANPTHYRNPREYFRIFDAAQAALPDGRVARLELVCCKCVDTYVRVKQNQNQVCWKWRRVVAPGGGAANGQRHFLDGGQYTPERVAAYQRIFGPGFVSPGGAATAAEFTALLGLRAGEAVLDVGCGVGGAAVHMARTVRGAPPPRAHCAGRAGAVSERGVVAPWMRRRLQRRLWLHPWSEAVF